MAISAEGVRSAFREQANYCSRLGSPFTALLTETLADILSESSKCGQVILNWPGDPSPLADGLPLRVAGALHALARTGQYPFLSAIYPPHPLPSKDLFQETLEMAFDQCADEIVEFLSHAPQTNEVGRSAVLIGGFLEVAKRTALPLSLLEIGASAGLNLIPDRYSYSFRGERMIGSQAELELVPEWTGPIPALDAPLSIESRRGCDVNPLDLRNPRHRERLMAYVWPDQQERLSRVALAINTALLEYPRVDSSDAADWVEENLTMPRKGVTQVLFHSIVWGYLPETVKERISTRLFAVGAKSTYEGPMAWLRFELEDKQAALRLSLWPGERDQLLARAHPHGHAVEWLV